MKSLITSIALVMAASSALAGNTFSSAINDDIQIDFLTWCEGNKVMNQNEAGKPYVMFNCEDQGLVCKTYTSSQFNRTIYSAACDKK